MSECKQRGTTATCPVCGRALEWDATYEQWRCSDPECPGVWDWQKTEDYDWKQSDYLSKEYSKILEEDKSCWPKYPEYIRAEYRQEDGRTL